MKFSLRTAWELGENDLARHLRLHRAAGRPLLDLTLANPAACGLALPPDQLLAPLTLPAALAYSPAPFGLLSARQAVARSCADHAHSLHHPPSHSQLPTPDQICLTSSTSEAYSYLFRLLCDPGDSVLVAQPSYPLFDFIARLDDVHLLHSPLHSDPGARPGQRAWSLDLHALESALTPRTRALILVHPNNPTGHYLSTAERSALQTLCARRNLALIVDEVFLDYPLETTPEAPPSSLALGPEPPCLTLVLSGLSKVCALPQMKLSWLILRGPETLVAQALARLEIIADTFLSVSTPAQVALPHWLAARFPLQQQIRDRLTRNLATLDARLPHTHSQRLTVEGGWTVVLRVPRTHDFALWALDQGVLVQPGDFYALPPGRIVLSLLTPPDIWSEALTRLGWPAPPSAP